MPPEVPGGAHVLHMTARRHVEEVGQLAHPRTMWPSRSPAAGPEDERHEPGSTEAALNPPAVGVENRRPAAAATALLWNGV